MTVTATFAQDVIHSPRMRVRRLKITPVLPPCCELSRAPRKRLRWLKRWTHPIRSEETDPFRHIGPGGSRSFRDHSSPSANTRPVSGRRDRGDLTNYVLPSVPWPSRMTELPGQQNSRIGHSAMLKSIEQCACPLDLRGIDMLQPSRSPFDCLGVVMFILVLCPRPVTPPNHTVRAKDLQYRFRVRPDVDRASVRRGELHSNIG
jgi:hypothetical protein